MTLAQGADVLVHEALWVPAVDRLVAKVPNATTLKKHIIDSHTSAEDCGKVAAMAGVKTLVLSHFVPPDDPAVTDQMWIDAAKKHFAGRVVLGQRPDGDLTNLDLRSQIADQLPMLDVEIESQSLDRHSSIDLKSEI